MLSYREALDLVLRTAAVLPARSVALDDALGLVAAADVVARDPVPPFTNSGVDGFACSRTCPPAGWPSTASPPAARCAS
jgi:molybdopterin molybdotransferase